MKLASVFTDHAVFQKGVPIRIFGEGRGHIKVEFLSYVEEATADAESWCITLPKQDAYSGPHTMKITLDGEQITLSDIYIGEVWIAAGQSNMEMPLKGFEAQPVADAADAIFSAKVSQPIRVCMLKKTVAYEVNDE